MQLAAHETLLIMSEMKNRPYIMETDFFGREWSEARILAELNGSDAIRVLKLNLHTLETRDVSEACAALWIEDRDANGYEIDPDKLPVFVADSIAWATRDLTVKPPLSKFFSTMDARTQGLVRGASF